MFLVVGCWTLNVSLISISGKLYKMAGTLMKAVRIAQFGGPEVLQVIRGLPIPIPKDEQVLVKVMAAGVNPADTYARAGVFGKRPNLPFTPGMDVAGVVEAIGSTVKKFKPGDRVYTVRTVSGGYAEFSITEEQHTFRLHDALTFQQGAALGVAYCTAYRAIFQRGNAKPGETILIHGASGGVGIAACQMARALGLHVLGTAGSEAGRDLVRKNGALHVFDHHSDDYIKTIMDITEGRGVDIIVEMLANVNLDKDLAMVAPRGRVMAVGNRGRIEIDPRMTMAKEADIRGVMLFCATKEDFEEMGCVMYAGQEAGWCRPVVGQQFNLNEADKAHTEVVRPMRGTEGKIILNI